jgi:hypothetical protein
VGIRKIVNFLGLSQSFGSVVFSGFFGFAIVVFSDGDWLMNVIRPIVESGAALVQKAHFQSVA